MTRALVGSAPPARSRIAVGHFGGRRIIVCSPERTPFQLASSLPRGDRRVPPRWPSPSRASCLSPVQGAAAACERQASAFPLWLQVLAACPSARVEHAALRVNLLPRQTSRSHEYQLLSPKCSSPAVAASHRSPPKWPKATCAAPDHHHRFDGSTASGCATSSSHA